MLVVRQGGALVVTGLIVGLLGAAAAARLIESALFGVTPAEPPTFGVVGTMLLAVGLLACWLPARRAARIDSLDMLRNAFATGPAAPGQTGRPGAAARTCLA